VVYLPGDPGPPVHLRQRQDGSVLVGERSQETVAADPSEEHAHALLAQAARFFPALRGVPVRRRGHELAGAHPRPRPGGDAGAAAAPGRRR
jgi:hypothetical protein